MKKILLPLTGALALAACSGNKTADNAALANDTTITDNGLVTLNDELPADVGNVALDNGVETNALDAPTTENAATNAL